MSASGIWSPLNVIANITVNMAGTKEPLHCTYHNTSGVLEPPGVLEQIVKLFKVLTEANFQPIKLFILL